MECGRGGGKHVKTNKSLLPPPPFFILFILPVEEKGALFSFIKNILFSASLVVLLDGLFFKNKK